MQSNFSPGIDRDQIYTSAEIASTLKVHPMTVHRWLKDGDLAGFKIGRFWRVTGWDLLSFIEAQTARARGG